MSTAIKFRGGTTAQHSSFTGVANELTVDTTKKTVVVHDNATPGGTPLAKESALASYLPLAGGTMTGALNEAAGSNVASAGTVNLTTATGNLVHITGTTTITAITLAAGAERTVVFDGALTLTHGASLLLPTAASIVTVANDCAIFRGEAAGVVRCIAYSRYDGTQVSPAGGVTTTRSVRQSVISGPVDVNGLSSFGGSTGSTTVTASGTLTVAAAQGTSDRTGSSTNPSWTGLSTNGTMYLYIDVSSVGGCTTGSTTLKPTYRWGGNDVVTNGQNTFNVQEMTMKSGNGSVASSVWRVFVGEVTVAGGVVSAITWYALRARYDSGLVATLPGPSTAISVNHNIGTKQISKPTAYLECITTDNGYAVGDRLTEWCGANGSYDDSQPVWWNEKSCGFGTNASSPFRAVPKGGGSGATALTAANWKYGFYVTRGW
jgi:hypothetical protein